MKPIKMTYKGFTILSEFFMQPDWWLITAQKGEDEYTKMVQVKPLRTLKSAVLLAGRRVVDDVIAAFD